MANQLFSPKLDLTLGELYESNVERTRMAFEFYRTFYSLEPFSYSEAVTPALFEYCMRRDFFVNVLAYQEERVFLKRAIGAKLGWELPGGGIYSKGKETVQDAVSRVITRDIPKVEVGELRPIAYLEKVYTCEARKVVHHGITFMGRVRSPSPEEVQSNEDIKGQFIPVDSVADEKQTPPAHQAILKHGRELLHQRHSFDVQSIEGEIRSTENIAPVANWIHDRLVRPIVQHFSSVLLENKILRYVEKNDYFLDVACGDDKLIFKVAQKATLCVGNDVQWNQIKKLITSEHTKKNRNVLFSNHDACALPFKRRFDLVLCKNLIHHMDNKEQLFGLLESLRGVSKKLLIIDPEKPSSGTLKARIWNWYYMYFLKDQGERFFTQEIFKQTITEAFPSAEKCVFDTIKTVKGTYMFSLIIMENQQEYTSPDDHLGSGLQSPSASIKAVVFDLDGLLADTESIFIKAIGKVLRKKGLTFHTDDYVNMDLQNGTSLFEALHKRGVINDICTLQQEVYKEYERLLTGDIPLMPGALEAVTSLADRYQLAIASSSKRRFIDYILRRIGLTDKFEVIVAREDTKRVKPDPECLQQVAQKLNRAPRECVFIEDSLRGMRAAKSIGMYCIVVPNDLTEAADFSDGDAKLSSLTELTPNLITDLPLKDQERP